MLKKLFITCFLFGCLIYAQDNTIKITCSDATKQKLILKIDSDRLNLTEDAIQDNSGGYVDIPEDYYYLKTDDKVYYLAGTTQIDYKNNINRFVAYINNDSDKYIDIKEFYSLKNRKDLKLIQKIVLQNSSAENSSITLQSNKPVTNILDIYFDQELFAKEYEKCGIK
jgi:lipopolysaccharide export LptBFGC system permease protein LptF